MYDVYQVEHKKSIRFNAMIIKKASKLESTNWLANNQLQK